MGRIKRVYWTSNVEEMDKEGNILWPRKISLNTGNWDFLSLLPYLYLHWLRSFLLLVLASLMLGCLSSSFLLLILRCLVVHILIETRACLVLVVARVTDLPFYDIITCNVPVKLCDVVLLL